jgi:hypothetical protein
VDGEDMRDISPQDPHDEKTYMSILPNKISITEQARAQDTRFILRFDYTTKVSYSPLRSPQRVGSFSTLILHKPDHKGQGIPYLKHCSQERGLQTSWGRPQIWRLPSNLKPS